MLYYPQGEFEPHPYFQSVFMDDQSQDWSVTTWAKKGKVQVALTSMPSRPSDSVVGYYAGEAPASSYEPVPVPEGEIPEKELSGDGEFGPDDYQYEAGPKDGQAPEYYVGYEDGHDEGYWEGFEVGYHEGFGVNFEDIEWV